MMRDIRNTRTIHFRFLSCFVIWATVTMDQVLSYNFSPVCTVRHTLLGNYVQHTFLTIVDIFILLKQSVVLK